MRPGVSWSGRLSPGERAGGDDDVRLEAGHVVSDEVQLAGRRVLLRIRSERAPVAREIDTTQRVDLGSQLVRGRVVAEHEHRAAEGDEVVNNCFRPEATTAVRHSAITHQHRMDDAVTVDPDQSAGQPRRDGATHVEIGVARRSVRRVGRRRHDPIVGLRPQRAHRALPLRSRGSPQAMPNRCATAAASTRLFTPSLRRMFDTCTLAVLSDTYSSSPI